jgi:hypothetical protein
MKLKILFTLGLLSMTAYSATSFSGSGVVGAKTATGLANVATGSLALLIVDMDDNGFLGLNPSTSTAGVLLSTTFDPKLSPLSAGLTVGTLFGGDRVATVTTTGASGSIANLLGSQDITAYLGKKFAVVWFDGLATTGAPANAPNGSKYGVIRGNDWTFPIADVAGALTFNSSDNGGGTTLWQANGGSRAGLNVSGFGSTTGTDTAGTTASASFVIVPEPSAALLGALGALGLLRRRRI